MQIIKQNKLRIIYTFAFLILLIIEVLIALYIHDDFIRPYIGDILVVIVIYTFVRAVFPLKYRQLPLYIFIFAAITEILQYLEIVNKLGLGKNTFLRILIGTTFDIKDMVCYAIGCLLLVLYEFILNSHN